jgi:diguanylate cyclase (GGDEF)-like protein
MDSATAPSTPSSTPSSAPSLKLLSELSRSLNRAQSVDELVLVAGECLRSAGLRGCVVALEGDTLNPLEDPVEVESLARVETILGRSITSLGLRSSTFRFIHTAATRREPASCLDLVGSLLPLLPHLSVTDGDSLRDELGRGPFTAVPLEFGDHLLGVLVAWGPENQPELLPFLRVLAGQIGSDWGRLSRPSEPAARRDDHLAAGTADAQSLRALIDSGAVRAAVQPVVRLLDGVVLGYQFLCRVEANAEFQTPEHLFEAAVAHGLERELDVACIRAALVYAQYTAPATLFLKVSVATLLEADPARRLARLVMEAGVHPRDVVVEVSERTPVPNVARLRRIVADLRSCSFRIAVDDAGAARTSLLVIAEVRPDFIKIDRDLIAGVHASDSRRALVVSMLSFGTHISARIIAEGIETADDLKTLTDLGIQFGQGNHLARPLILAPARVSDAVTVDPGWFSSQTAKCFPSEVPALSPTRSPDRRQPSASAPTRARLPHALSSAALALQAEHDPQRILAVIAEQLSLVVPVDDLTIYEADHANHRFIPAFATGPQTPEIMAQGFPLSVGMNGWAFALGTPQNLANAGAHPAALTIPNTPFEHESLLLIPLVAGDHKLGMLNCRRLGLNRFSDNDLEAASLFGHTAAAAWHNAQLYEELARRAMTDGLTGLFNSRWLREAGEREIADCRRRGTALSIVLVDLDHFKKINDTGGHAAGDVVLQRVADELRRTTRAGDAAVRLGGEEFILVLRDSDGVGASRVAGDLRRALAKVPIPAGCGGITQITASIGIASFPEHGAILADLVRAADVAMYGAKRDGRDRVKLALGDPVGFAEGGVAVG